jgi:hypothetical protein
LKVTVQMVSFVDPLLQLRRLLEDTGEIKGTPAFVYGC